MGRKEMIIEGLVRNAGIDPDRVLNERRFKPNDAQLAVLSMWRAEYGDKWKEALKRAWATGNYGYGFKKGTDLLKQLKSQGGVQWLMSYQIREDEEEISEGTFNFKYYYAAQDAEKEFSAALKKQYGKKAQDKRYTGTDFNKETQAAYEKFRKASDALHKETLRARGESIEESADFSTNRRASFREGWEDLVSSYLLATGFVLVEYLTKRGYSTYGAKVRGASLWVKFEGDTSLPYARGEFVIHINMEHKLLSPTLSVKANRGDDKKSGTLKTPSKLSGKNIFNSSPESLADSIMFSGDPSWGDYLGIYD